MIKYLEEKEEKKQAAEEEKKKRKEERELEKQQREAQKQQQDTWYHKECTDIPTSEYNSLEYRDWYCPDCLWLSSFIYLCTV